VNASAIAAHQTGEAHGGVQVALDRLEVPVFHHRTPAAILDQQTSLLRAQLDGVFDGGVDAIHDARVATRRIRELLALVPPAKRADGEVDVPASYREAGAALGKVRDIDVQIALIRNIEAHAPQTAPSLVLVRQDHERRRLAKLRKLIKTLERLDVGAMLESTAAHHPAGPRRRLAARGWQPRLRRRLLERARTAAERISHATGIYFPNRAHHARIAIKQLRYAAEIAQATGAAEMADAIKSLRKGQEVLGELHDRKVLSQTLERYAGRDRIDGDHIAVTEQVIEGEVRDLHARYLTRRAGLREACAEIERMSLSTPATGPLLAVGGGMLVAGLSYFRNRSLLPRRGREEAATFDDRNTIPRTVLPINRKPLVNS
jgi:CHAD domain-containing protein